MTTRRQAVVMAALMASSALAATPAFGQVAPRPAQGASGSAATATPAPRPLEPLAGDIDGSRGMIRAHAGMIRAHVGDISPFWGDNAAYWDGADPLGDDIRPFWGTLEPYRGMIRAHDSALLGLLAPGDDQLSAMRGMIRAHLGELGATAGMIRAHDGSSDYAAALVDYRSFVQQSSDFWGRAVTAETGKSFDEGFADAMLARHGIDLDDPASIARLDADAREMFFLDWHDGLMQFSGADQVDHWMKAIGWTPSLTQQQGSGSRAVIGMVDFFVAHDADIMSKLIYSGGYKVSDNNHGAGVASLIVASHDGRGIMGIAPRASVAAFNPFDETGTASWADVRKGIVEVNRRGASVVNLSLGVPGYTLHPEWRNVFRDGSVSDYKDHQLYVIAAGNSGTVQTGKVNMKDAFENTFLVVGSVAPDNTISSFSNQPGWVCLTEDSECKNTMRAGVGRTGDRFQKTDYLKESGYLMNRFLVAPGELLLVSDGHGGVTRMSGTSFSAPLVAGAIALIHDRWPWLKESPRDVAKILLDTATDLGEAGADPVYGRGLLNIEAAQSPLDFDKLKYELWNGFSKRSYDARTLRGSGMQSIWNDRNMYFTAFEELPDSERDFLIPLSGRLFGTTRNGQYFQEFVYGRFVNWMKTGVGLTDAGAVRSFSGTLDAPIVADAGGWSFNMRGRTVTEFRSGGGNYAPDLHSTITVASPSQAVQLSFGSGDGALALGGQAGLQSIADFDSRSGGVNPLLGFATGGAHIASGVRLAPGVELSVGASMRRNRNARDLDGIGSIEDRVAIGQTGRYGAGAYNVRVDFRPAHWLGLAAAVTRLDERRGFLGTRSLSDGDFGRGTQTDGVTVQADVDVTDGITLFGSATGARSSSKDASAAFRIAGSGVLGTSYQLGIAAAGVLGRDDRLRVSLSQPLTVERGTVDFTSVMVIDRETGEKGLVTQSFDVGGTARRAVAELRYGTPLLGGRAAMSLFGRSELRDVEAGTARVMVGSQASLAF